ncbi:MAG: Ig-like domain-containing protein [Bacteroidaceae bacterium]|nr:Ig-like domain-containing protein [Bacteroidaceae bacterium]
MDKGQNVLRYFKFSNFKQFISVKGLFIPLLVLTTMLMPMQLWSQYHDEYVVGTAHASRLGQSITLTVPTKWQEYYNSHNGYDGYSWQAVGKGVSLQGGNSKSTTQGIYVDIEKLSSSAQVWCTLHYYLGGQYGTPWYTTLIWNIAPPIYVESITLSQTSKSLNVGETLQLNAQVNPSDAEIQRVTWSSSNERVATVSDDGLVTALKAGSATITCTAVDQAKNAKAYCSITVTGEDVVEGDWSMSGNYDIKWYNKNQDEFTLSTNKELAGMAYLINNGYTKFEEKTIKLTNNIDLSGKKWVQCNDFKGVFDGQGHTIFGVYIGNDEYQQTKFGFWKNITNATIKSINLQGIADVKYEYSNTYLGALVGYANQSTIQNCTVDMDFFYDRDEKTSYSGNNAYIGGICGYGGKISNSIFMGNFTCDASTSNLIIGGIAGSSNSIEYCESYIYKISAKTKRVLGVKWTVCGIGESNVICCCSIIGDIDIACGWTGSGAAEDKYYIGGITSSSATNCYSSVKKMVCTSNYAPRLFFGGISSGKSVNACFSNSDVEVDVKGNAVLNRMYDGTTLTSEQMKSSAFLDELNVYPILEMGGPVWKQKDGDYPYINDIWDDEPVSHDEKCATPTIGYANGKLTFQSETEGVEFHSSITDTDIKDYITSVIDLTATYNISVYATKEGYENSDTATATLCWIDAEPFAEGTKEAEDNVKEVKAMPVLIQANNGVLNISGAPDGADIFVYDTGGRQLGTTKAINETAKIVISQVPQIVIVKIGDKAVKVHMK